MTGDDPSNMTPAPSPDLGQVAAQLAQIDDSFAGLWILPDSMTIESFWMGPVPQSAEALARSVAPAVQIEMNPGAAFARSELRGAAERLSRSHASKTAQIAAIEVNYDGSGILVHVQGVLPNASERVQLSTIAEIPESAIKYRPNSGLSTMPTELNPGD